MGAPPGPGWRLAVDFGTTNTAAAVEHQGHAFPLRLAEGSDAMPSGVLVTAGEIKTGTAAARGAAVHPAGFEPTPKRRLAEELIVLDGGLRPPVELVAAVLRTVYERALAYANRVEPAEVVLTHPQAWHEHRVGLLRAAAEQAGLPAERLRFLPEPVATAWHYASLDPPAPDSHLAVLDLGGGTCDVALLRFVVDAGQGRFELVDSAGIDPLGGHDFDARLETWVRDQLRSQGQHELLEALEDPRHARARATLRDDVRAAKESLSGYQSETVGVIAGEHAWVGTVTRAEYEQLVGGDIERAVALLSTVLDRSLPAGMGLDRLYLTGGSSLTPLLQRRLEELLPGRVGTRGDPKQVTAIGALQAPPDQPATGQAGGPPGRAPAPPPTEQPAASIPGSAPPSTPAPTGHAEPDGRPIRDRNPVEAGGRPPRRRTRATLVAVGVVGALGVSAVAVMALRPDPGGQTPTTSTTPTATTSDEADPTTPGTTTSTPPTTTTTTRTLPTTTTTTTTLPTTTTATTTSEAPAGPVIGTAQDMSQLIADNQVALRSSCATETDVGPGVVVAFVCSDPLIGIDASIWLYSFGSVEETRGAFDETIVFAQAEIGGSGYLEGTRVGDGAAQGYEGAESAVFFWTDESTMTLSYLASSEAPIGDLYIRWLEIPDYP